MDWILALALATFVVLLAFLYWNWHSTKRHHESGGQASGIGGPADPLSGNTEGMRNPDALRANLDEAAAAPTPGKGLLE